MTVVPTMRFAQQAQTDISRISAELADLQRQIASGKSVDDLRTLGDGSTRLISTAGVIRMDENRVRLGTEIEGRMRLQASAMQQASTSSTQLVRTIREAALNKDGGNLTTALEFAFLNLTQAMNEQQNGVPLFGGERVGSPPVKVGTVTELAMVSTQADLFDEAARKPRVDLGGGLTLDGVSFRGPGQGLVSALTEKHMLQAGKHPGKINLTDVDNGLTRSAPPKPATASSWSGWRPPACSFRAG